MRFTNDLPLPLLVTGIAGVTGYNAFRYFRHRYGAAVIGIRQENNWPLRGPGIEACNAEDRPQLAKIFSCYRFASVLNCSGNCALKACELDPPLAWRTNVEGVEALLDVCQSYPVRLVHLSIDLVFSGRNAGNYVEEDSTDPVTVYGKTMAAAESILQNRQPGACTLRISLPMGVSFNGHAGAIDWIQSRFQQSKPATLYFDEVRTPTYTDCLNRLFEVVLRNRLVGLFHAGGPISLSLYQIAQIVNRIGGFDADLLIGCLRRQAGPVPPRAGNVTLSSTKLIKAIGFEPFDPWPYYRAHRPTHDNWHRERPVSEGSSPTLLAKVLYRNPHRSHSA